MLRLKSVKTVKGFEGLCFDMFQKKKRLQMRLVYLKSIGIDRISMCLMYFTTIMHRQENVFLKTAIDVLGLCTCYTLHCAFISTLLFLSLS